VTARATVRGSAGLSWTGVACALAGCVLLAACGSDEPASSGRWQGGATTASLPPVTTQAEPPQRQVRRLQVGKPYKIRGKWYTPEEDWTYDEIGSASWYGPGFHGKKTANGETYDQYAMTAAHTTLPLPVIVRVTNLKNGRSVNLRVNDRGPFAHNRIIDVSRKAAEELGFIDDGVAKVRVQVLAEESLALVRQPSRGQLALRRPAPKAGTQGRYFLQAGSFSNEDNAEALAERLYGYGDVEIQEVSVNGRDFFRVRLGPFADADEAVSLHREMLRGGHRETRLIAE